MKRARGMIVPMFRRLVALVVGMVAAAGCLGAAPGDPSLGTPPFPAREVPDWREAEFVTFQGRLIPIPAGHVSATDGESFLYAVPRDLASAGEDCAARVPAEDRTRAILLTNEAGGCLTSAHPGVACVRNHVCEDARGEPHAAAVPPASSPRNRSAEPRLLAVEAWSAYDAVWNESRVRAGLAAAGVDVGASPWRQGNVTVHTYVEQNGAWVLMFRFPPSDRGGNEFERLNSTREDRAEYLQAMLAAFTGPSGYATESNAAWVPVWH